MAAAELERDAFADVMATHCAGVAVATCSRAGEAGRVPPSVLLSIDVSSRSHDPLLEAEQIGVHLLAHDQAEGARVFSSKSDDKFGSLEWSWDGEVPRLGGVLAYMRCRPDARFGHHDHTILVATVEEAAIEREELPLVYLDRRLEWHLVERSAA
jgi:flavin reductase (DIM6/NTAB) family NADH-FMN oxidoreductase RutF